MLAEPMRRAVVREGQRRQHMGVFDHTARRAAKRDPAGFLRWVLPRLDPALAFVDWLDTRTAPSPPESELTCDVLAELVDSNRPEAPWVFVIEFQTEPRGEDLERALEYALRFRRERRPTWDPRLKYLVGCVLLNLTGPAADRRIVDAGARHGGVQPGGPAGPPGGAQR
jgi:hypothetical protein